MSYALTGTLVVNVPQAAAGDFISKLNAGVPADVTGASGDVDEKFPSSTPGSFQITANFSATVNQGDIGSLISALEAAATADGATLVSLSFAAK